MMMMDGKRISLSHVHEHPLAVLTQDESSLLGSRHCRCSACEEEVNGGATPAYGCDSGCKFYLHKACAEELAGSSPLLVNHPLHPLHPLILLRKPPYESGTFGCIFCHGSFSGLVYHCGLCQFNLNVHCALLQSSDDKPPLQLQHSAHQHSLTFVSETHNKLQEDRPEYCSGCGKQLSGGGSVYRCMNCYGFQLHKECAELALPLEITLSLFHPPHPLTFNAHNLNGIGCKFCCSYCARFVYECQSCEFLLHPDCALLLLQLQSSSNSPILERSAHQHPLIFIEKLNRTIKERHCVGCCKELSEGSSIYICLNCDQFVCLHKECAELPLEINHPLDRKHPLTLLQTHPSLHPKTCSCDICRLGWKGFVYYCHVCKLGILPKDVEPPPPPVIKAPNHGHPWFLIRRPISFVCDFCGTDGDRTPYLCTTCDHIVHRDCIDSLPQGIKITRHRHPIFHSYFIPASQLENSECRICHKEVNTGFGSYRCRSAASNCNYIVHVKCATDKNVWDGTIVEAGNYEGTEDEEGEFGTLITDVIRWMRVRGEEIAIEIKHAYHDHNLLLNHFDDGSVDVEDDNHDINEDDRIICDGCMKPISSTTPFYACDEQSCRRFLLHKTCAELPQNMPHPSHKHSLSLVNSGNRPILDGSFCCACNRYHHGFSYSCRNLDCHFKIDIQCSSLSDSFMHASHRHPLFLIYNAQGNCSGCGNKFPAFPGTPALGYICTHHDQGCNFILDFWCLTLPQIAPFKYDKHPLKLAYRDVSDPNQRFCDLCEEERDPNPWFYNCVDCNTTLHPNCALGDLPLTKAGRTEGYCSHPHRPLTVFKKIWNCPPCNECNKLCYGHALECKESNCNYIVHFNCRTGLVSKIQHR